MFSAGDAYFNDSEPAAELSQRACFIHEPVNRPLPSVPDVDSDDSDAKGPLDTWFERLQAKHYSRSAWSVPHREVDADLLRLCFPGGEILVDAGDAHEVGAEVEHFDNMDEQNIPREQNIDIAGDGSQVGVDVERFDNPIDQHSPCEQNVEIAGDGSQAGADVGRFDNPTEQLVEIAGDRSQVDVDAEHFDNHRGEQHSLRGQNIEIAGDGSQAGADVERVDNPIEQRSPRKQSIEIAGSSQVDVDAEHFDNHRGEQHSPRGQNIEIAGDGSQVPAHFRRPSSRPGSSGEDNKGQSPLSFNPSSRSTVDTAGSSKYNPMQISMQSDSGPGERNSNDQDGRDTTETEGGGISGASASSMTRMRRRQFLSN